MSELEQISTHLKGFWDRMVAEQAEQDYCQASCYVADWMAHIGFLHDYGSGVYATSEKGRYFAEHPFNKDNPNGNWDDLAHELYNSPSPSFIPYVIQECLDPEA